MIAGVHAHVSGASPTAEMASSCLVFTNEGFFRMMRDAANIQRFSVPTNSNFCPWARMLTLVSRFYKSTWSAGPAGYLGEGTPKRSVFSC